MVYTQLWLRLWLELKLKLVKVKVRQVASFVVLDWCAVILPLGVVFAVSKCALCCRVVVVVVVVIGGVDVILGLDVDVDVVVVFVASMLSWYSAPISCRWWSTQSAPNIFRHLETTTSTCTPSWHTTEPSRSRSPALYQVGAYRHVDRE